MCHKQHCLYIILYVNVLAYWPSPEYHFLSQEHCVQFYKSYIQPHIDFCNIVWANSCESNKRIIFKLQKRAS